ncbi:hypothetical protein [Streptomyces sp. NPDC097610]|uniref:hypothetical protein n=1 Tax=Streptomyces sp. NPDC097610 TaxID=3157227 RepID=UPI00332450FB
MKQYERTCQGVSAGAYSSREAAQKRIERARSLPGFTDEPHCFFIEEAVIDEDQWTEGYVTELWQCFQRPPQ